MFNRLTKKQSKSKSKIIKKMFLSFLVVFIFGFIFLVSAEKINEWTQKYNNIKNETENKTSSVFETISKVKKISDDISNGINTVNKDIQDLRGETANQKSTEETFKNLSSQTKEYLTSTLKNKSIDGLLNICLENGIDSAQNCLIKIKDEISDKKDMLPLECQNIEIDSCVGLIKKIVNENFIPKNKLDEIKEQIKSLASTHITLEKTFTKESSITQKNAGQETVLTKESNELIKQVLPVLSEDETFLVLPSEDSTPYNNTLPAILMIDDDNDGLPNEMEERLGTDPQKADTDGDGYSDYIEVKHDYDPNGPTKKDKQLSPVELAILDKVSFEQPVLSDQPINETLKINEVKNKRSFLVFNKNLEINGQGRPNEIISLYIYSSMPIVITIKTDANGNWVYNFDKKLVDGDHKAYVVINNNNGEIEEKSNLFNFFVKNAIAVTNEQYLQERTDIIDRTKLMIFIYIFAGLLLVLLLIAIFLYQIKSMQTDKEDVVEKEIQTPPQIFRNYSLNDLTEILKRKNKKK